MAANQIENIYNDLVSSMDREFRRLKQVLAEQEIKEEEERLKKIQVNQPPSSLFALSRPRYGLFRRNSNMKRRRKWQRRNWSNSKRKNFASKNEPFSPASTQDTLMLSSRRSALALRQKEEENFKGKLTAEETKRQVRTTDEIPG